ncbi:hypothetical protein GXW71_33550 [Roseomonas hellenica]|uniref:PH domain-containing protein n=1 Tax=Plastoroseomonas hellenica TaxID=2687306 RepID=A0ABS5F9T2_9PROT|nr:hypothetical protein [Plastoroseomonas hellenica]MBR0669324.1 hypothetical protein [Plastoroseomonas hellenica]
MADLHRPHEIHRSPIKLAIPSFLILGAVGACLFAAWKIMEKPGGKEAMTAFWVVLGIAAAFVLLFLIRILPQWLAIGEPALILSKQGIAIRGKDPMAWSAIVGNTWRSESHNGIPTGATIELQGVQGLVTCGAFTLKCSAAEYVRLCDLYRQAAAQERVAAAGPAADSEPDRVVFPGRATAPDGIGEYPLRRRVPAMAFLLVLGGLALAGCFAMVIAQSLAPPDGSFGNSGFANKSGGAFFDIAYPYALAMAGLAIAACGARATWAWLSHPKSVVIGEQRLRYGPRSIPYAAVASLDAGRGAVRLILRDGSRITLPRAIWADGEIWTELLSRRTHSHLFDAAWQALGKGEKVDFGPSLDLDSRSLRIRGRPIPLDAITDLHVQSGAMDEVQYRTLRVRTARGEHAIDERKIRNAPLFLALIGALLEPSQGGKR